MKNLNEQELIAITGILKLESIDLAMSRVIKNIICDEDLKKLTESAILEKEGRIQIIKKFIHNNFCEEVI